MKLVYALLFLYFLKNSFGLRCSNYIEETSIGDEQCADGDHFCIYLNVSLVNKRVYFAIRSCSQSPWMVDNNDINCTKSGNFTDTVSNLKREYLCCDTDNCNKSNKAGFGAVACIAIFVMLLKFICL